MSRVAPEEANTDRFVFTGALTMTHRCLNRTPTTSTLWALINDVRQVTRQFLKSLLKGVS